MYIFIWYHLAGQKFQKQRIKAQWYQIIQVLYNVYFISISVSNLFLVLIILICLIYSLSSDKLLNEYSGDSEESLTVRVTSSPPPAVANKVPPVEEIEEFFAKAEKYEQERFAKKWVLIEIIEMISHTRNWTL